MRLHEVKPGYEYINGYYLDLEHMTREQMQELGVQATQRLANARDEVENARIDLEILQDVFDRRFGKDAS